MGLRGLADNGQAGQAGLANVATINEKALGNKAMAEFFEQLQAEHITFIQRQHMFFVATAAAEGTVNLSPKGMDSLRIIDERTVVWLNLTGSGNETAAQILQNPRMTVMFCSFDKQPLIMRLYGKARAVHPRDHEWQDYLAMFPLYTGARQFFVLSLDQLQTSCGFAVPYYTWEGDRPTLVKSADNKGRAGIEEYWRTKNTRSIDGYNTGITESN